MTSTTTIDPEVVTQIAISYGAQHADRDIARGAHKAETDCAAYDYYQKMLVGLHSSGSAEEERAFAAAFAKGYEAAFEERGQLVFSPMMVEDHVVRACYHCRVRKCALKDTAEGQELLTGFIIICMDCIKRLGSGPLSGPEGRSLHAIGQP